MPPHSRRPRAARQLSLALLVVAACALGVACSDSATSQATCERVERARCEYPACAERGAAFGTGSDCAAYATNACAGGTVTGITPSPADETACVEAIRAAGTASACAAVRAPSTLPACGFLVTRDAGGGG
jgi:hypothetical protein